MSTAVSADSHASAPAGSAALRRVLLNAGALLGAYLLPRALTFTAALIAARALGPSAFGSYGSAASLAMIFSIFASLGMLPLLVRELARAPERAPQLLAAAHRLKLIAGAGMLLLLAGTTRLLGSSPDAAAAALLLGGGHVAWSMAENFGALLQARERLRVWLTANVIFGAVSAALGATAVLTTHSVPWFCAGFATGQLAALLYLLTRAPRLIAIDIVPVRIDDVRRLARAALPFAVAFLALTIFYKFDVLLLDRLRDARAAGMYAAGYRLVDMVHALAVIAAAAVYPRLSRAGNQRTARRTIELFALAAVPAAAALWLIRGPLVALLFGEAYSETAAALALLAPAAALLTLNILIGYLLGVADRAGLLALCYSFGVALKLTLGVLWMPTAGAQGAARAMFVAEFGLFSVLLLAAAHAGVALPRLRPLLLALIAGAWAPFCAGSGLPAAATLGVFVAGILLVYGAGGAVTLTERAALRGVFASTRVPEASA